jgi:rare lipoprotein A
VLFPKKGGGLRAHNTGGRRLLVGSLLSLGLLGVPLLLLGTGASLPSAAPGGAGGGRAAADALARPNTGAIPDLKLAFQLPSSTTTTTTAPPPARAATPTTAAAPSTTTTTINTNSATGIATWYSEAPAGSCASPWLPKGVTLTVTAIATGVTITCLVDDREADNPGRVVDLSPSGFEALAPLSQGVVQVTVSW